MFRLNAGTLFYQALAASETDPNSGTSTDSGVTKVIRDPSTGGQTSETDANSGVSTDSGVSKVIRDPSTGGQTEQTKAGKGVFNQHPGGKHKGTTARVGASTAGKSTVGQDPGSGYKTSGTSKTGASTAGTGTDGGAGRTRHPGQSMTNTGKTQTQNQYKNQTHQRSNLQARRVRHQQQQHQHAQNGGGGGGAKPKPTPNQNAVLSDLRMKKNVSLVGWSPMGIPIYQFSYINQPNKRYRGTIAQAITRIRPDAIIWRDGLMWVDYSRLDIRMEELPPAPVEKDGPLNPP